MKIIKFSILGLIIFVLGFAYLAPASILKKILPGNVVTAGLNGTIWNGSAQTIMFDQIGIQNTKWSANPINLLTGKVHADVSVDSNNLQGQFETSYSGGSSFKTKDLDLNGELSILMPYFEKFGLTINGQFDAKFDQLYVEDGVPKQIEGILQTYNTSILGLLPLNLGDVRGDFAQAAEAEGIIINLNNANGEIDLTGNIIVNNNGSYSTDLALTRNMDTPDELLKTIQYLGKKINDDTVKLNYTGKLGI